ncbi:UNVERIFIED_CONTAM: hypothetical protein GTU68_021078, partial [Idotea baltica]|nr:hypothetical protein [Idotea baltica]
STETETETIERFTNQEYKWGFVTDIEADEAPPGLNEEIIRFISAKKEEPEFMLEWRLKAYKKWLEMEEPDWAFVDYEPTDYQKTVYYSAPKVKPELESLDQVDPDILATYEKLGIPLLEQKRLAGVAIDAVFDSVSVATTYKEELSKAGVIFCPISEAVREHPELIKKYLGSVVPYTDNFFATLNSAVFTDGSFVYIPKGVKCPLELSTYFRINAENTGQFERTLIIADEGSSVSYLEGCTAPQRSENQLHAAVVELVALDNAEIKYSTRGMCAGKNSKISWTQVETGSAITWKYPSCILKGDNSVGGAENARNFSQCDSMLMGDRCGAHTFPYIEIKNPTAKVEHEATTSRIGEDQIFYCNQRGISTEDAISMIVHGFCKEVFKELPMEFAIEARQLLAISLEGSVG